MPQHPVSPAALRARAAEKEREMIPKALLRAMFGIALLSLVLVSYAVITKRPLVGVPPPGKVVAQRSLVLEGIDSEHVLIRDTDGKLLADIPNGGFITVVQRVVARNRTVNRVPGNPPIVITRYDNGRLAADDPATGWTTELYAFGPDSKAAFERLLALP